jgi:hypothetical protein
MVMPWVVGVSVSCIVTEMRVCGRESVVLIGRCDDGFSVIVRGIGVLAKM